MAIGIDDIEFDDLMDDEVQDNELYTQVKDEEDGSYEYELNNQEDNNNNNNIEDDALTRYLQSKGIEDPSKIKFEDEDGKLSIKDWNDLTPDEQYNILNTENEEDEDTALDDTEIDLINQIRRSEMSPEEFVNAIKQQGVAEYIQHNQAQQSDVPNIDDFSDEEIFALDLKQRIDDITDDEVVAAIEKAKENPDFYSKQVKGIRAEYKRIIEENNERTNLELQQQQEAAYNQFANSIIESISSFNQLGDIPIELDENEMTDIADLILERDATGISNFGKMLNDPAQVVKMAWFITHGDQAFRDIQNYFSNEIKRVSQSRYDQGFKEGSGQKATSSKSRLTYRPAQNKQTARPQSRKLSIDDLD